MRIVASGKNGLPAEGEHTATLIEYEDLGIQPNPFNPGTERQRIKLVFQLEGGSKQFHWATPTLHPMSKFYELATALLRVNPPEALEMDDLVGRSCLVSIEHFRDLKGQQRSKIVDVRRLPNTRRTNGEDAEENF